MKFKILKLWSIALMPVKTNKQFLMCYFKAYKTVQVISKSNDYTEFGKYWTKMLPTKLRWHRKTCPKDHDC